MESRPDIRASSTAHATRAAQQALRARLAQLQDRLGDDAGNLSLLSDVADLQLQLAQWPDARATLHQLLATVPQHAAGRYRLAVAERALGDAAAAQHLLTQLVSEGHAHPVVLQELARSEAQLGHWDGVVKALALFDTTAMVVDEADEVRLLRIRALHHLGYLDTALAEACAWREARGASLPAHGLAAMASLHLDASQLDAAAELVALASADQLAKNAELAAAARFIALARSQSGAQRLKPPKPAGAGHWITEQELATLHRQWVEGARQQGREDALNDAHEAVRQQLQAESHAQADRWHQLAALLADQMQALRSQLQSEVADWTAIAVTRLLGNRATVDTATTVQQVLAEAGLHQPITLLLHAGDLAAADAARAADPGRWPVGLTTAAGAHVLPGGGLLQSPVLTSVGRRDSRR